jgi:hypothetical protein
MVLAVSCKNSQSAISMAQNKVESDDLINKYKILKINEVEGKVYIIYAQKGDSIYKIVSVKEKYPSILCAAVKVDNLIPLNLIQIFPQKSILGVELSGSYYSTVKGLNVNDVMVEVDEKSNNALYKAANLNGLCLITEGSNM